MNFKNLSTKTKIQLGAIVAAVMGMQVDQVKNMVMPLVARHPHLSTIATGVFTLVTLLQNPTVELMLGLKPKQGA